MYGNGVSNFIFYSAIASTIAIIIGLIVSFFVIRSAVRANKQIDLLTRSYSAQWKLNALLEKIVIDKFGDLPIDFYYKTDALLKIRNITGSDFISKKNNELHKYKVKEICELDQEYYMQISSLRLNKSIASKLFNDEIDRLKECLSEDQIISFRKIIQSEVSSYPSDGGYFIDLSK